MIIHTWLPRCKRRRVFSFVCTHFGLVPALKLKFFWFEFWMGTVHDVWVKQRSKVDVVPVSPCSSLSPLSIYLFLFVLVCLYLCVTGSSQPLCRWWRLVWSQMTPLYSQSDVSYRLYDSIFGHFSQLTASITLLVLGLLYDPFFPTFVVFWLADCGAVLLSLSNGMIVDHKNQPVRIWACSLLSSCLFPHWPH